MIKLPDEPTKEKLLQYVTEEQIFEFYLNVPVQFNQPFCNPLRKDDHPTCKFFIHKNSGSVWMKDFAGYFTGDCFSLVMHIHSIPFYTSLKRIDQDFRLSLFYTGEVNNREEVSSQKEVYEKKRKEFKSTTGLAIKRQSFTETDLKYWSAFNVGFDILKLYNVYSTKIVWKIVEGQHKRILDYSKTKPMYTYVINDRMKIYRPLADTEDDIKWISNTKAEDYQGLNQLHELDRTDVCFITKSMKDVMVMHSLGYPAVAPQSEQANLHDWLIDSLQDRYEDIFIFYDNDPPGKAAALKEAEVKGLVYMYIPEEEGAKDISDYLKEYGVNKAQELLKTFINEAKGR